MSRPLSSSCRGATDHAGPVTRQSHGRSRNGAPRWALAVLVGCVALFAVAPVASALPPTGISGKVTDAETSEPISGAEACAYESAHEVSVKCGKTEPSGEYTIEGLAEASYKVRFTASHYGTQWYSGQTSWSSATTVEVKSGVVTPNVGASITEEGEGSVAGRVTSASTGQGVGGVEVCVSGSGTHCVETNSNGEYTLSGLPVGSDSVSFSPAVACEEELGEKIRCQPKSDYISQSVSVKVKSGKTETANAVLRVAGQISGTVTNASITHPGLAKIEVCATRVTGPEEYGGGGCAYTSSNGQYTINGLESGFYKVEFNGYICSIPKKGERECSEVYITEYYHGQQTFKKGETTSVTTGSNTGGINESLREAFPTTPVSTAVPALTGTAAVGQALSCSQGSWSHEPTYVVYQWLRNGTVIAGQTGSTYTLQAADQGHSITCSVTAGNGAGAASANSNTVAIPVPLALFAGVKVKGSVASVTLRCPGPGACSGVMKIVARVATKHGRKKTSNVTIGVASFSIPAGKRVTLKVHLTGQGRKLLATAGRGGLKVQITGSGIKAQAAKLKPASKRR
jgi:hypothetical protein